MRTHFIGYGIIAILLSLAGFARESRAYLPEVNSGFYHYIPADRKEHQHKVKLSKRTLAYVVGHAFGGVSNYLRVYNSKGKEIAGGLMEGLRDQNNIKVIRVVPEFEGEEFTISAKFQVDGYIFTNQSIDE